ncbi:LacI family DNA-binding transcriptional regulator [Streptomyces europaeiscabiei]|uniref:LacI family DNA-binding transcriptional regulator n=1 Tax=Streptomyces europaeiscabiei TaxID=146819 RepID=UPI00062849EE|nr:LacI family DNA-binding transcriptional regulator [Streptomyces europaeiscabiei]MDX2762361.1 LacI family DNA-binding transcriptional regulator [Streptomyces europaeiscabiei]MDX2772147.1 LacI family DNA-binding transcriptional regulator [Streptomyces europaeiscabiei]MDX3711299.1 LacI family DNA-binding transcriptional regulator [Streptomyces europaeiscabiei]MDX3831707.1 LacI family DNA-binding transcriptional regulator [Streptomyces europaeiscabiei]MDX3840031.1 LacI family DNA-binding transc
MTRQTRRLPGRRPTLDDVARGSGVSKSTVSRVINGEDRVRAAVIERVREVIAELGYVPNSAARQLVTRRNNAIAVVASQPQNRLFIDPFFDLHLRGIRKELVAHGAQPVLLFLEEPEEYPRVGEFLGGGHVDGALLFSLRADDPLPGMIDRLGLPAVFGGRPLVREGEPVHDRVYVDADNRGGAREAVRHLVSLGRERVATITGPVDREASAFDRLEGYRDILPDAPPLLAEHSDYTRQGGFDAMAALLDRCPDLDAVFVASDLMASGALQVLREHGRRVPDDVAVVGFDDLTPIAEHTDPPLTTVHQDIEGMGRLMARLLFSHTEEQADGGAPAAGHSLSSVVTPTRLVVRQSA